MKTLATGEPEWKMLTVQGNRDGSPGMVPVLRDKCLSQKVEMLLGHLLGKRAGREKKVEIKDMAELKDCQKSKDIVIFNPWETACWLKKLHWQYKER